MVEFDIDDAKFTLVRKLTSDELKAIIEAYDKMQAADDSNKLTLPEFYYQMQLASATLQKCFALSREEIENLDIDTFKRLFREVVEYCDRER